MQNIPPCLAKHQTAYAGLVDFWMSFDYKMSMMKIKHRSLTLSYIPESDISALSKHKLGNVDHFLRYC